MHFEILEANHCVINHSVSTRSRAVMSYEFDIFNDVCRNLYIDGALYTADANCVNFRMPGQVVHSEGSYDNLFLKINLCEGGDAPITQALLNTIPTILYPAHITELKQIVNNIIHIHQYNKTSPSLQRELLRFIYLLLSDSFEEIPSEAQSRPSRIKIITAYIAQHYAEPLNMEHLASLIHLDKYYFIKYFKKKTGMTPQQYLIQKRIQEAKALLESVDLPIKEISYMVGYANTTYFVSSFTKLVGISPAQYRSNFRLPG